MEYKNTLVFETTNEMETIFTEGNKPLSDMIVDVALENLTSTQDIIPVVSITTKDTELIYDVMIDRVDMIETLEQNLDVMEDYEDYERCQQITDAIHFLKSKK
jgi:hypothetical protein